MAKEFVDDEHSSMIPLVSWDQDSTEDDLVLGKQNSPLLPTGATSPLPDHVRREIIELGLPDDGYNYLIHLSETKNGGDSAVYQNTEARVSGPLWRDFGEVFSSSRRYAQYAGRLTMERHKRKEFGKDETKAAGTERGTTSERGNEDVYLKPNPVCPKSCCCLSGHPLCSNIPLENEFNTTPSWASHILGD